VGKRWRRSDAGGTVWFAFDGRYEVLEYLSGTVLAVHTADPRGYGAQVSQRRGSSSSYYHFDGLGSVDRMTDGAGAVANSYVYDAWGNVLSGGGTVANNLEYVGQQGYWYESALGLYLLRARWYDPVAGLFLSRDPSIDDILAGAQGVSGFGGFRTGEPLGIGSELPTGGFIRTNSLYVYCGNNPVTMIDPSGKVAIVIAVPAALICLAGTYCLGFKLATGNRFGGTTTSKAQQGCINNAAAWLKSMGMAQTSTCAAGASISAQVPAGDAGATAIDPACLCSQPVYLAPATAKCGTCYDLVQLISALYHECVHTRQCALTTTDKGRETEAYCNEAAFDHMKLGGLCQRGLCGGTQSQINSCIATVHQTRNEAIAQCKQRGGTVNYNIPFN
jgi:RHS repeat-associated protein